MCCVFLCFRLLLPIVVLCYALFVFAHYLQVTSRTTHIASALLDACKPTARLTVAPSCTNDAFQPVPLSQLSIAIESRELLRWIPGGKASSARIL